jgi:cytochrome P450
MSVTTAPATTAAPASPAGPLDAEAKELPLAPMVPLSRARQTLRLGVRQIEFVFGARRRLGDVFRFDGPLPWTVTFTCHPDHVKSLMTASPEQAQSATGESPLRPIVGPDSVLTAVGARHLRQRKLLLPPFHGEAIARYSQMITDVAEREIDRWPVGKPFALAPRMQDVTLDVIMAGIFGIQGTPAPGSAEAGLRRTVRALSDASTNPLFQLVELMNVRRTEAVGLMKAAMSMLDRYLYAVIKAGREAADLEERTDILALLLRSTTEDGEPLTDRELRNELLTLILAGHETTANQLAWTFERLVRTPAAYDRLRESVRAGEEDYVEATIHEGMRSRPVIPIIGRRMLVDWQLGEFRAPADSVVLVSILLLHHREDLYPEPFAFRPERFLDSKPGTYTWIPFGGGIRRCLGATLAMAEQRIVLSTIARRTDLQAADPAPEKARHRNVTMIPRHGARVVVTRRD